MQSPLQWYIWEECFQEARDNDKELEKSEFNFREFLEKWRSEIKSSVEKLKKERENLL